MALVLQRLAHGLERLQEACPGLCGFMNWAPMGAFYRLVQSELPIEAGERVLDFGCGRGVFSHLFDAQSYFGVDLTPSFVRHARKKHPAHGYAFMDGTRLGFSDGAFDSVLVVGVFHHLDDDMAVGGLREVHRVLKPGGRALVLEPVPVVDRWNLYSRLIKSMDAGHFIRPLEAWPRLVGDVLPLLNTYHCRVGLNDIAVMKGTRQG